MGQLYKVVMEYADGNGNERHEFFDYQTAAKFYSAIIKKMQSSYIHDEITGGAIELSSVTLYKHDEIMDSFYNKRQLTEKQLLGRSFNIYKHYTGDFNEKI